MPKKTSGRTIFQKLMVDPSMLLVVPVVLSVSYFVFGACITTVCCAAGVQDCFGCSGLVTHQFSDGDDVPPAELDPKISPVIVGSKDQAPLSETDMCY